jgi:hypothetical protein
VNSNSVHSNILPLSSAETDETGFGGFVTMLLVHFREEISADLEKAGVDTP